MSPDLHVERVLVIANQTLGGREMMLRIEHLDTPRGAASFHLLVPASDRGGPDDPRPAEGRSTLIDDAAVAAAKRRLELGLTIIGNLGCEVSGEIGAPDPIEAARAVLSRGDRFHRVLLSTLPSGLSRWLGRDVPHRLTRALDLPVEHVESTRSDDVVLENADAQILAADAPLPDIATLPIPDIPVQVLLVEDSATDAQLTRIALERSSFPVELTVATTGDDALVRLRDPSEPVFHLVLLDLKMPGMSGHELLAQLNIQSGVQSVPIVVLTTSTLDEDRTRAHELGASAFVTKEPDFSSFQLTLESVIRQFASGPS